MLKLLRVLALLLVAVFSLNTRAAERDVGVVVLHGKWDRAPTVVLSLTRQLEAAGYQVAAPMMPWSLSRSYDATYPQALDEIEAAAKSLRDKGATRIVIAGHSLGGNAALAYAASGRPVDAIVVLAPGHAPEAPQFRNNLQGSVTKARQMIAAGNGADKAFFDDINQGQTKQVRCSADSYLSYFDPEGMGSMPRSAAAIKEPVPLFMAVGSSERSAAFAENTIYKLAPRHEKSQFSILPGDHIGLVTSATPPLLVWLKTLGF